jgi:Domain of Unknown Function (DUF1080)
MHVQRWLWIGTLGAVMGMVPGQSPAAAQSQPPAPTITAPSKTKMNAPTAMASAANQLTDAEKKEGWVLLFDGKSMTGWRAYKKSAPAAAASGTKASNGRWAVQNGALCLPSGSGQDTHGSRDIITDGTYKNFDLRWQWKIASGGNIGLKYFVTEKHESAIGHEYQMIDDDRHPDAKIGPHRSTGAFYDVLPPNAAAKKVKPIGEWNESRVVVNGNHVEHWLNGAKVVEYTLESPEIKAAIAKSKFKEIDDFDKALDAHILLQDHGNEVCFRSIKILPKK